MTARPARQLPVHSKSRSCALEKHTPRASSRATMARLSANLPKATKRYQNALQRTIESKPVQGELSTLPNGDSNW
eukprot:CAMPEP_0203877672 /NCGR_PEP_ID=MMETSP0359-20131031/22260_1 /ASSEMBLY_ACC=CAM_ASM_000338 /TAXON_ID=268821 /ORGANISM="Scrippsiella Hangoei, Strain SHTV-5" /LENGTH=74 /DNA_ID=CAMNT_0050796685 /DNA_START=1 /DNA_END=222 /DNA_ORIENTATION=+